jgi:hypothetical protein
MIVSCERDDLQQSGMFSCVSLEERIPQDHPLRPIRKAVDEIFRAMNFLRLTHRRYPPMTRALTPNSPCQRRHIAAGLRRNAGRMAAESDPFDVKRKL